MNEKNSLRKYVISVICSAVVVASAAFCFRANDTKQNTSTIIIESNRSITAKVTTVSSAENKKSPQTTIKTTKARNTRTQKTTDVNNKTNNYEYVYIDINTADAEQLMKLSGIGEVLAEEIIKYREENGSFQNIEEIMNVSGIGSGIFNKIQEHIYVNDPVYENSEKNEPIETNESEPETDAPTENIMTLEEAAPVDINSADAELLQLLPHVDTETAEKILIFRQQSGGFKNEYELLLIEGLSRSEVDDILPYVSITEKSESADSSNTE